MAKLPSVAQVLPRSQFSQGGGKLGRPKAPYLSRAIPLHGELLHSHGTSETSLRSIVCMIKRRIRREQWSLFRTRRIHKQKHLADESPGNQHVSFGGSHYRHALHRRMGKPSLFLTGADQAGSMSDATVARSVSRNHLGLPTKAPLEPEWARHGITTYMNETNGGRRYSEAVLL